MCAARRTETHLRGLRQPEPTQVGFVGTEPHFNGAVNGAAIGAVNGATLGLAHPLTARVQELAERHRFFHWHLEFPEVFADGGGFDCVLGNPPWERIKLQEQEFFAARDPQIASAPNKAARQRLIDGLPTTNPPLAMAFEAAKRAAEAESKFVRDSGRFPLTAVGDVNTYALFAEQFRRLLGASGRAGMLCPTGVATDDSAKAFFGDLIASRSLASLIDFENREALFPDVDSRVKFCALTMAGGVVERGEFAFFLTNVDQLQDERRHFELTPDEIELLNPNTRTCPVFRTRADAELTKAIYGKQADQELPITERQPVPVLVNETTGDNPWGISFLRMLDMSNDSHLFRTEPGEGLVPLYEGKMLHQFDHRWATYEPGGSTRDLTDAEKMDPGYTALPRYWVDHREVEARLAGRWDRQWLLGFRDITNGTNERTAIFSLLPRVGVGNNAPIVLVDERDASEVACLLGNLNSLVFDYVTRQKIGGTHMNFFLVNQLPALPPSAYRPEEVEAISMRVLDLVYTSWEMQPFAQDVWRELSPKARAWVVQQWESSHGGRGWDAASRPIDRPIDRPIEMRL